MSTDIGVTPVKLARGASAGVQVDSNGLRNARLVAT